VEDPERPGEQARRQTSSMIKMIGFHQLENTPVDSG
jgi:hypothetical protein